MGCLEKRVQQGTNAHRTLRERKGREGKEVIALHRVVAVNDIPHRSRMNAFEIKYTETHTACHTLLCGGTAETEKQACVESLLPSSQRTIQHEHMTSSTRHT